jgi:Xaa-Pro dipeptidase
VPVRGFTVAEFEARLARAQSIMRDDGFDALVVCSPHNVRYFSGFDSQFWESPTRPWFIVVPANGAPIAVIPEIGAPAMACTWLDDIRTWPAPRPGDDGVSLLAGVLVPAPTIRPHRLRARPRTQPAHAGDGFPGAARPPRAPS